MRTLSCFIVVLFVCGVICACGAQRLESPTRLGKHFGALAGPRPSPQHRLIALGDWKAQWMTPTQVNLLASTPGRKFMDVTDHMDTLMHPKAAVAPVAPLPASCALLPFQASYLDHIVAESIADDIIALSTTWTNRNWDTSSGKAAAEWIKTEVEAVITESGRTDVTVELFPHSWLQPSVIARIEGDTSPSEVVVLGAHEDSISFSGNAPGADDDASGSSSVLAVMRALVLNQYKPKRTLEFHWYAAEEVGLRGSGDIASTYRDQGVNVVSMLQQDMTGYNPLNGTVGVIQDFTSPAVTAFVVDCIKRHTSLTPQQSTCGYRCSDHGSWNLNDYAAAFVIEAPMNAVNPAIHTPNDKMDRLDPAHLEGFARFALAYAVSVSWDA